ncbi:MAG: LysR family transcriptional regulator [Solirubrobacteraceae bacterium]
MLTTDIQSESAPPGLIAFQAEFETVLDPALTDSAAGKLVDRLIDVLVVASHLGLDRHIIDRARSNTTSLHANPLADAHDLLLEPTGSRLRELANADDKSRPPALPRSWRAASPALTSVLLQHRDQRLSGSDRLRYRSMTGAGRCPEGTDMTVRLRAIPTALWPDWAIRLRPIGIDPNNFRISAAAALCLPGAIEAPDEITGQWPRTRRAINLWRLGRLVCDDPHGTAILGAVCALTDALDRRGAPIDYTRRRVLVDQIELLDADKWVAMCLAGGMSCGRDTRLRYARLSLWETLTGGIAEQAPPAMYTNAREDYVRYDQFILGLSRNTAQLLTQHARSLLDAHGCEDEPLTWSPPCTAISTHDLPGPDPDALDPQRAHALLASGMTPGDAAEQLGITLPHLRYVVRTHPIDEPSAPRSGKRARTRLAARATPEELRQLIDSGSTLTALANRFEVSRETVHRHLVAHEIAVPLRGRRRRHEFDRDWLDDQYRVRRRTVKDISAETGATASTIRRLLRQHAIPVRPRGLQALTAGDGFPQPLANAVVGQGGIDRVRRFQVYARTRSLQIASKRLGVFASTLTTQLAALEWACGGRLLERLTRDQQPQHLTLLGQELLRQADLHLGPNPQAPSDAPKLVAAVLATHGGTRILAKFTTAATSPTLADAAATLHVQTGSLRNTIRNIEAALRGPVLADHRGSVPLHLTPLGRRLLAEARKHLGADLDTPPILPQPLARVLATGHRADQILAKFVAAAMHPTFEDAAAALKVLPSNLRITIRLVEAAVGGPVFADDRLAAPLRLTPVGRRLLRQALHHRADPQPGAA